MNRFLKEVVVWSFIIMILSILLDGMITTGLKKTDIRKYAVWNDIYNHPIDADLLVVGSSRVWCGYNTYILDSLLHCNSYNLGIDGHPIDFQLIRYNTYRRFNRAPKVLIVNTDFLSTLHNSADSQYEREQFFPYIRDKILIDQVARQKHLSFFDRYLPFYRYFGYKEDIENGIASFWGRRHFVDGGLYKGFRGNDFKWDRGEVLSKDTSLFVSIDSSSVRLLDGFISEANKEGIRVLLVKSPVYSPLIAKFSNVSETDSLFKEFSQKYDVPILDYYYSEISQDTSFFSNASHLNRLGADLFTKVLSQDIIMLLGSDNDP